MIDALAIPVLLIWLLGVCAWKRLPMYDLFVKGAKDGLGVAVNVLPNLAAMMAAITLMQASGLLDALCALCAPLLQRVGIPPQVAPLALLRPVSGSASLAMVERLMAQYGPDSRIGLVASVVMASGETVFYTVCVYQSALAQRTGGRAIPCALAGTLVGVALAGCFF